MTTVYLDELKPGMSVSRDTVITGRHVQLFGEATGDMNPLHFDEDYARGTVFRGRVAHGVLTMGFISALIGMELPGEGTIFISASVVFKSPVRIGDTVTAIIRVREVASRDVILDCSCHVGDRLVLESEATVRAPKRPAPKD